MDGYCTVISFGSFSIPWQTWLLNLQSFCECYNLAIEFIKGGWFSLSLVKYLCNIYGRKSFLNAACNTGTRSFKWREKDVPKQTKKHLKFLKWCKDCKPYSSRAQKLENFHLGHVIDKNMNNLFWHSMMAPSLEIAEQPNYGNSTYFQLLVFMAKASNSRTIFTLLR